MRLNLPNVVELKRNAQFLASFIAFFLPLIIAPSGASKQQFTRKKRRLLRLKRRHGSTIFPSFQSYHILNLYLFLVWAPNSVATLPLSADTYCHSIADSPDFTLPGAGESSQNWSFYHPITHKRVRHCWHSAEERARSRIHSFPTMHFHFLSTNQKLRFRLAFPLALNFIASGECVYAHR